MQEGKLVLAFYLCTKQMVLHTELIRRLTTDKTFGVLSSTIFGFILPILITSMAFKLNDFLTN